MAKVALLHQVLRFNYETKRTIRYSEDALITNKSAAAQGIGSVYLPKDLLGDKQPKEITVTVEVEHVE